MPRRYHRAPEFRREHAYVLLFLPACTLVTCVSLALADVYRVPGLARACTVHSCVTREGFRLRVNLQKTRVHGCAHAIRAILNASTMLASIKFKSSCTVWPHQEEMSNFQDKKFAVLQNYALNFLDHYILTTAFNFLFIMR